MTGAVRWFGDSDGYNALDKAMCGGIDGDKEKKEERKKEIQAKVLRAKKNTSDPVADPGWGTRAGYDISIDPTLSPERREQLIKAKAYLDEQTQMRSDAAVAAAIKCKAKLAYYVAAMAEERRRKEEEAQLGATGASNSASPPTALTSSPDAESDDYKPSRSGMWGVYERPRDISKAYGGGKQIPIGGGYTGGQALTSTNPDRDDVRSRVGNQLWEYRYRAGAFSYYEEKEHAVEIKRRLGVARSMVGVGRSGEAMMLMKEVEPLITYTSELGGNFLLEMALIYDIQGRKDKSQPIYDKLKARSLVDRVKLQASMMGRMTEDMYGRDGSGQNSQAYQRFQKPSWLDQAVYGDAGPKWK